MTAAPKPPVAKINRHDVASQWQLMWWSFKRHRLAMVGLCVVGLLYFIVLFCEFLAPFDPIQPNRTAVYHPPQGIHLFDRDAGGSLIWRPHAIAYRTVRDPISLAVGFQATGGKIDLTFFGSGTPYKLWGLIDADRHLITAKNPNERFYLLGTDRLGRDMLSRILYGARISMSIGLVGVTISLFIGLTLGGMAGYFGGTVDTAVMRLVEFVLSLPTIPIWLALSAAMPADWPMILNYFVITTIVSLVGWTELARVVRGRFLALKHEDFVLAARLDGASEARVIFRHMLPALSSHIIAAVTLAVPLMILAETSLSFLGLGLQPPTISWGVLLKEAQNIRSLAQAPWLLLPGAGVVLAVLSLNFLGDGLRDAADPYNR